LPRGVQVARWNGLTFAAASVNGDDAVALHKEPKDSGIELADVTQLEEATAKRFRTRFAVVLPLSQLRDAGHDDGEVIRVAGFEFVEKIPHGTSSVFGLIKLYGEIHFWATSILMYRKERIARAHRFCYAGMLLGAGPS
jgi:hypothetical protein